MNNLLTTKEAAKKAGVNMSRIRQLVKKETLQAEKVGRDWLVDPASLKAWMKKRKPGRPAQKK